MLSPGNNFSCKKVADKIAVIDSMGCQITLAVSFIFIYVHSSLPSLPGRFLYSDQIWSNGDLFIILLQLLGHEGEVTQCVSEACSVSVTMVMDRVKVAPFITIEVDSNKYKHLVWSWYPSLTWRELQAVWNCCHSSSFRWSIFNFFGRRFVWKGGWIQGAKLSQIKFLHKICITTLWFVA